MLKHFSGNRLKARWIIGSALFCALGLGWNIPSSVLASRGGPNVKIRVETDKKVFPEGKTNRGVLKVTLEPAPPPKRTDRPPVNLAIVLDRSGSMAGEKLKKAQDAAIEALRRLSSKDIFSVIIYDDNVATIVPAQYAQNPEWIEGKIRQIHAGGSTALFGGVSQGAAEIRKNLNKNFVNRIILLSDGIANIGPSSPEDLGRLGTALSKEGISVTTVGVGLDYNEDLMTRLSQNSDGNTYFVESSRDLPNIFAAELSDVLNVVAKNVRLIIECGEGVKPISIIGREGRIRGQEVQLSMNQLYGNQEKYVLIEVELPAGKDGSQMVVASATVSFENPFTQQKEKQSGRAQVRFSKSENEVAQSKNAAVEKEYILNLGAIAKDNAISFADKGKKKEAARVLRKSIDQLKSYAGEYDDATISQEAHEMEEAAQKIETKGMDKRDRKKLRTDSYRMKVQQKQ